MIMWTWMYTTRIPAMQKIKVAPQAAVKPGSLDVLLRKARQIADNYRHLHQQPTLFYALALVAYVGNLGDGVSIWLAWGYVGLRILHSLVQATVNLVALRFGVFALASLVLMALCVTTFVRALGS
jgi:hypothetical protein